MKIKGIITYLFIVGILFGFIHIMKAETQELPEKEMIEAMQKKDTPQLILAMIDRMGDILEKDNEKFPEIIREVEEYTRTCEDSSAVALLHSMTAEMYNSYANRNRWKFSQRTSLSGFVPEDIREWSMNLFEEKVKEELAASLSQEKLLQQTPASRFEVLLEKGDDARVLRPTLYDFLLQRAIEIQPSEAYYQQWMAFRKTQPEEKALVKVQLDYLSYQLHTDKITKEAYGKALAGMDRQFTAPESRLEIRIAELYHKEYRSYSRDDNDRDRLKGELYRFCKENIEQFATLPRVNVFKNKLATLSSPKIRVMANNNVYPGDPVLFQLEYRNVSTLTVNIYENLRTPETAMRDADRYKKEKRGKLVKTQTFQLPEIPPYLSQDTTLTLPGLKNGLYEYEVHTEGNDLQTSAPFSVSRLAVTARAMADGSQEIWVTDFKTGRPMAHVPVRGYNITSRWVAEIVDEVRTDAQGIARFKQNKRLEAVRPILEGDTSALLTRVISYYWRDLKNDKVQFSLYTDRSIYRPGQTVYFKGIAYVNNKEEQRVVPQQPVKITLTDANRQEIAHKELTTNENGSVNGAFVLPQDALNGYYSLRTDNDVWNIRVEAYKRPTFQLHIDSIKEEVTFGKPVKITGDARLYSGVQLQGGEVEWTINHRPFFLRDYQPYTNIYNNRQAAAGKSTVDSEGKFSILFTPQREQCDIERAVCQSYEVNVKMTDSKGETQEARYLFSVGDIGMVMEVNIPQMLRKETAKATITAQTLNQQPLQTEGTYKIFSIDEKDDRFTSQIKYCSINKEEASGQFTTASPLASEIFAVLPSGRYRIIVEAKDQHGKTVKAQSGIFVIYSDKDNCPPVYMHTWQPSKQTECAPGENATILFGTSDKPAYVLYELFSEKGRLLERKQIVMNNENRRFTVPFLESYGNGVSASFSLVKNGELYTDFHKIVRKAPDKKLNIKAMTFRDYLLPGSSETWKFRISTQGGSGVNAEVLASMYDASLDQLASCTWNFDSFYYIDLWMNFLRGGFSLSRYTKFDRSTSEKLEEATYHFDRMGWPWIYLLNGRKYYGKNRAITAGGAVTLPEVMPDRRMRASKNAGNTLDIVEHDAVMEESPIPEAAEIEQTTQQVQQPAADIRRDFSETAFFYPVLTSNNNGEVEFSFTVPESNTSWKLQLLAITPTLQHGYLQEKVVTSKPFMVVPNLPRFLRTGDHAGLSTQLINRQAEAAEGTVTLELFNPEDEKIWLRLEKHFTVGAQSNSAVAWNFDVPEIPEGVAGCRIVAQTGTHSDGEQHLLPVLPDEMLVTESFPFYLNGNDKETVKLPKEAFKHPLRLTLEMTANPVWYAVQALPGISQPQHEDAISWSAAYFSSVLTSSLLDNNPELKKVITAWKTEGKNENALLSALEKNQELKNILLKETPWVLEAKDETEQKQQLQVLFDQNNSKQFRSTAIDKLADLQNYEGGWSWFKGMPASRYITQQVLKHMAQLTALKAIEYGNSEKEMQIKALNFLDRTIQKDYNRLQEREDSELKPRPTSEQLEYLWIRSLYRDIPEWGDAREAIRYYTGQAEKQWKEYGLHDRALIAMLMQHNGKKAVADAIIATFRKTATSHPEKGMYWANNRSGQSYRNTPIDTHCLIMAAFESAGAGQEEMNAMKQWLLSQKRVQHWGSTPSTVNAIHTLLNTGSDWTASSNKCVAEWNGQQYQSTEGESGTGYLKTTIPGEFIKHILGKKVKVSNHGEAPAWGSVYLQYFSPINRIRQQQGNALHIEKKLFLETNNGSERQLVPVEGQQLLKVGDKVITRLTIRNDRTMEYVALKDLRPGGFEPATRLSGTTMKDGAWCYQTTTDQAEEIFFDRLPEGTFVIEYASFVSRSGNYAGGNATIQCLYAPEFISHTAGITIEIE